MCAVARRPMQNKRLGLLPFYITISAKGSFGDEPATTKAPWGTFKHLIVVAPHLANPQRADERHARLQELES